MVQNSEKWKLQIGKSWHIVSGEEMALILKADQQGARFIRFRDLIINPAFIVDAVLIESASAGQIEAPYEGDLPAEEWLEKHAPTS